jgi:hypothetical protein
MRIEFDRLTNRLLLFEVRTYERYYEFSWRLINSTDKHFSEHLWFCKIQFIYDSIFLMIALFWCFWWIITSCLLLNIQMKDFFSNLHISFVCLVFVLISFWWNLRCSSFYRKSSSLFVSIFVFLLIIDQRSRYLKNQNSFEIRIRNLS